MNPEGHISGETLTALWRVFPSADSYSLSVERCDQDNQCEQVFHQLVPSDPGGEEDELMQLQETSEEFAPCTFYNVKLKALDSGPAGAPTASARELLRESSVFHKPPRDCDRSVQTALVAALCVLGALAALCLLALLYYHRRRSLNRIQRVRSKVYSRLYSRERYERPVSKAELARRVGELLSKEEEEEGGGGGMVRFAESNGRRGEWEDDGGRRARSPSINSMTPLQAEFEELERLSFDTIQRRVTAATSAANRARNRYNDIVPYDANRVRLREPLPTDAPKGGGGESSDYVNASTVGDVASLRSAYLAAGVRGDSATSPVGGGGGGARPVPAIRSRVGSDGTSSVRYIAAQGPGEETCGLFWEMIWQQDVRVIVMLTNLVEGFGFGSLKCSQYWPEDVGGTSKYRDLQVLLYDVQEAPDYTVRKFDVQRRFSGGRRSGGSGGGGAGGGGVTMGLEDSGGREIVQVQYKAWRDRSAPSDPGALLQLIDIVRALAASYNAEANAPWLVHCSAGVGRTGTFIAVDQLTRVLDDRSREEVDVFNHVYCLRRERRHMVQTAAQYAYVYRCLRRHAERRAAEEEEERREMRGMEGGNNVM